MFRHLLFLVLAASLIAGCTALPNPEPLPAPTEPAAAPTNLARPQAVLPTPTQEPARPQPRPVSSLLAFAGADGNIWLLDTQTSEQRQVTQDAAPFQAGVEAFTRRYYNPQWSSDGRFLAFQEENGTPEAGGYTYNFSLSVYDLYANSLNVLLPDRQVAGFSWRPGTTQITFAVPPAPEYFGRSGADPDLARGIWAVDATGGAPYELVPPLEGLHLVLPQWSPGGELLSFEEIEYMEGRGRFAYYNVQSQAYQRWDRPVGNYTWTPNAGALAYDTLTYIATGEERIYLNSPLGANEQPLIANVANGYAYEPRFSPTGDRLAYVVANGLIEATSYTVAVLPAAGGEAQELGQFEQPHELTWSPDGTRLAFSTGPYDSREILEIDLASGEARHLAQGSSPAYQP